MDRQGATGAGAQTGRERLLSTARELFTRHGASNVGVNDVTAAAGLAKMTLYNNFRSKDALIRAVYEEMIAETLAEVRAISAEGRSEVQRIHDLFDHFDLSAQKPDFRGCPFVHASLQATEPAGPIHALVRSYKRALREHVFGLLDELRPCRAESADLILLLLDGVVAEAYLKGVDHPAASAKRAVTTLLSAGS